MVAVAQEEMPARANCSKAARAAWSVHTSSHQPLLQRRRRRRYRPIEGNAQHQRKPTNWDFATMFCMPAK
jgi:hypothetical protein